MSERFVEQQNARIAEHGARQRRTLSFAAREPRGAFTQVRRDLERLGNGAHSRRRSAGESEILRDRHVRKERVVLENQRDAPLLRRQRRNVAPVEFYAAALRGFQSRQDTQQRRFSGAARAENRQRFAVAHGKRNAVERCSTASCVAIRFAKISECE